MDPEAGGEQAGDEQILDVDSDREENIDVVD